MIKFLQFIWELPQNILGFLLSRGKKFSCLDVTQKVKLYIAFNWGSSISLGRYVILGKSFSLKTVDHELGHTKQSLFLGPLYLIIIGIPSFIGASWDTLFHNKWSNEERVKWYYSLPWEAWADKLGGVDRGF
jgi:hypothetical protein